MRGRFNLWFNLNTEEEPMLKEFKEFIMRGNVLDLAIAVIIGGAFGGDRHFDGERYPDAADGLRHG